MTDLVRRLRKGRSANEWVSEELAHEAADYIERLRVRVIRAEVDAKCSREFQEVSDKRWEEAKAENERLREALKKCSEQSRGDESLIPDIVEEALAGEDD